MSNSRSQLLEKHCSSNKQLTHECIPFRCINFADNLTDDRLKALADACHKATFGLNDKDVLDEAYRKAGKMDTTEFATLLSPGALGLLDIIATNLLRGKKSAAEIEAKLYKLNVYGTSRYLISLSPLIHVPLL